MGIPSRMLAISFFLGLLLIKSSAGQASVGQECWSRANGVVSGGCASGTQCGPWLPPLGAGIWDGSSAWYCLNTNQLADGASCNYDAKIGYCSSGTCCSGTCGTCTTSSSSDSSDSSDSATTTPQACSVYAGEFCDDTLLGSAGGYPKTCCDGLTCTAAAGSTRTYICGGSDIADGSRCQPSAVSGVNATCTSASVCTCTDAADASTCTCNAYVDQAACTQSGVGLRSMCYNGDVQQQIKGSYCCGSTSTEYCIDSDEKPAGQAAYDKYCMPYKLAAGAACGLNAAANFAGACDAAAGLECSGGVCVTAPTTQTTPTTPTTEPITTPSCTATGTDAANLCYENGAVKEGVTCCSGNCDGDWPIGSSTFGYVGSGYCVA